MFTRILRLPTLVQRVKVVHPVKVRYLSSFDQYDAIPPNGRDVLLSDINEQGLKTLGDMEGIVNLSPAVFPSVIFPVEGVIHGSNNRLMICMPCRRATQLGATINVWFVLNTGSNHTYLARKTIQALLRENDLFTEALKAAIQDPKSAIECFKSPSVSEGGCFEDANLLGMQALHQFRVTIQDMNWETRRFKLVKN